MSQEIKGIKNLKEVVDLAITAVQVGADVAKDGKLGLEDVAYITKLFPVVGPALADLGEVPAEIGDLSEEEAAEVVAYVAAKLTLESEKARAIVDKALKAAFANYALYLAVKA